jgi:hypothetical protein
MPTVERASNPIGVTVRYLFAEPPIRRIGWVMTADCWLWLNSTPICKGRAKRLDGRKAVESGLKPKFGQGVAEHGDADKRRSALYGDD